MSVGENVVQNYLLAMEEASWKKVVQDQLEENEEKLNQLLELKEDIYSEISSQLRGLEEEQQTQIDKVTVLLKEEEERLALEDAKIENLRRSKAEKTGLLAEINTRLSDLDEQLKEVSSKALEVAEIDRTFPLQKTQQNILYSITKVVWGKQSKQKPQMLRGYVCSSSRKDVSPFDIDIVKTDPRHVKNYLWDYVADGISQEWKRV